MKLNKFVYCLVACAATFTAQSHASELVSDLKTCATKSDSLERLVCYDQVAKSLSSSTTVKAVEEKVVTAPIKAPMQTAAPTKTAKTAPKNETTPKIAPQTTPEFNAEDSFGVERKYVQEKQTNQVRFVIKSVSKSLRGKYKFKFENGQMWEQKDTDKYGKFKAGETVIIKRGVLDAFYLKKPDANRTIRVKRVK